ncbi:MAG: transglycosylase domain-containing protein [Anaerolineales bacterium]
MTQGLGRSPRSRRNSGESASGRFKRLAASDEENALSDTRPSQPVKISKPAKGNTQPSRAVKIDQTPPDEAPTIFPGAQADEWTPAPPPLGHTPAGASPPPTDESGMPLPRRVAEVDPEATQVTGAAYSPTARSRRQKAAGAAAGGLGGRFNAWRQRIGRMGCLPRILIYGSFALIFLLIAGVAFALYEYAAIASTLPSVDDLRQRASQFETTRILDSKGNLLYEILDPTAGRRTYVRLEDISPYMIAATLATEDEDFYTHPGFNIMAIVRAFTQNYSSGEVVSGASTITQQLARALLFTPEEASDISYLRKVREAILASEITRRYTKDEILELYLNEIYFGNLAYGVEAAAQTYFGTSAGQLSLAQASFLAGLPQAPSVYDVHTNRGITLIRHQSVLSLMVKLSAEDGCIYVSNNTERLCVPVEEAATAGLQMLDYTFISPDVQIRYPHWVHYIRALLEEQFDPQTIYRSGFTVYTTLDPELQNLAQETLSRHVAELADRNVGSGALVAIRPSDGYILAMVGSADFNEGIDGQINMAISPRQPGSSIKPLTYAAALEKGWTASTLIWDVESEFPPSGNPDDPRPPYIPKNYDNRFHGPVTVRAALANSFNVPAVKTLDFVGIYDNPDTTEEEGLVAFAHRMGITDLEREDYGLALTLGGGEVQLLELTNAYAIFANQGRRVRPLAITRIVDHDGNVLFEAPEPSLEQVIRPEHAFLISSILSDNNARQPMFGSNSVLNLPFTVAAKTGTTDDFRDNWTLGFTPDLAVGVWVGNPDNTEMQGTSGLTGAAPIWAEYMQAAINKLVGGSPAPFVQPSGIVEKVVCAISGTEPSRYCDEHRREMFAVDQPPLDADEDLWQDVLIDTWTRLEASSECGDDFVEEVFGLNVDDVWGVKWITQTNEGGNWAEDLGFDDPIIFSPKRECKESDPRPKLQILSPNDGTHVNASEVSISIIADATANFEEFVLEWAPGDSPRDRDWVELFNGKNPRANAYQAATLDMDALPRGAISIRLSMFATRGGYAEVEIVIFNELPEPTAVPTPTKVPTNTPSLTPQPSETPQPTQTPTLPPPADTPLPSETPTAMSTETPTAITTETPTESPSATPTV